MNTTDNQFSCDSPFSVDLEHSLQVYQSIYATVMFLVVIKTSVIWYKRREHPILRVPYVLQGSIFIFNEPNILTSCTANLSFSILALGSASPFLVLGYSIKMKSMYNKKVVKEIDEKLTRQNLNFSPTTYAPSLINEDLKRLKFLSSLRFAMQANTILWLLIILSAYICSEIFCDGLLSGGDCTYFSNEFSSGPYIFWAAYSVIFIGLHWIIVDTKSNVIDQVYHFQTIRYISFVSAPFVVLFCILSSIGVNNSFVNEGDTIEFSFHVGIDIGLFMFYWIWGPRLVFLTFQKNETKHRALKLEDIFGQPVAEKLFEKFLIDIFCVECIKFVQRVRMYETLSTSERHLEAIYIFSTFVEVGSIAEINVPANVRENISDKISKGLFDQDLFYEAKLEMYELLTFSCLPLFKGSQLFNQLIVGRDFFLEQRNQ
eukprot:snap_masked-scaffold_21-processed-gene-1.31-mRNA-1 protein AED:1.00 eAED:1.00 QI:0/0/0/0/1/1/2/0/429